MIDLGESTPFVECKFKDKTYRVYANDKNIMQIEKLVAFYRSHVDKLNDLDKRDTAALNGDKDVKPIDSEEFREIGKQLIDETKAAIFDVFDDLLQELYHPYLSLLICNFSYFTSSIFIFIHQLTLSKLKV